MTITRNFSVLANGAGSANNLSLGGATLGSNALAVTGTASISGGAYISNLGGANKIINGDMVIDQRNAGASVTATTTGTFTYTVDRWYYFVAVASKFTIQQNAGSVTPPTGFSKYLGITSSSAYTVGAAEYFTVAQNIEGYNAASLNWGTANAQSATLSFWAYSSLTGTFGGCLTNATNARSYPFTYTISVANTWTNISVTVPGDTSGTWQTTTSTGIEVFFGLGVGTTFSGTASAWAAAQYFSATGATSVVGTSGAKFYFTGVKLEVGSIATPFVPDDYQVSFVKCQRYTRAITGNGSVQVNNIAGFSLNASSALTRLILQPPMRAAPSLSVSGTYGIYGPGGAFAGTSIAASGDMSTEVFAPNIGTAGGQTANAVAMMYLDSGSKLLIVAEL